MKATVKEKIGPYDGPFRNNLITYKLISESGVITWHEDGSRGLKANVNDTVVGIVLNRDGSPNYRKSKPVNTQLNMF